jgi:NTE family protein
MARKRVAIACQGGGSQCAFVAGALKTLLSDGVEERYRVVALSGTSGGALTAALAWSGLLERANGEDTSIDERIVGFWRDLTAQTPQEVLLDATLIQLLRMVESGLLPSVARSPSSWQFRLGAHLAALFAGRQEFTDLGALLLKHFDFTRLPELVRPDSPVLLVGAADVLEGTFKVFSSARGEIKPEALLASAAIPTLFPAVTADGHAYWDGIFSNNPPIGAFLRKALMGDEPFPEEIWIIQVNRTHQTSVPEKPGDIFDRRNQLAGNLSLHHELQQLDMVNLLIQEDALTERFRSRFRIDNTEPIAVRFIRMSPALQEGLDYPSKLSRQPSHIARLMADGVARAKTFLDELRVGPNSGRTAGGTTIETH